MPRLTGTPLSDTLFSDQQPGVYFDEIFGLGGNDDITGGDRNDTIEGGAGADRIDGGDGVDTASYTSSPTGVFVNLDNGTANNGDATGDQLRSIENVTGSHFSDTLLGDEGQNTLNGLGGNDNLYGQADDDTLVGGLGNDNLFGGTGDDRLFGGGGDDLLVGGQGGDILNGGSGGTDTVSYVRSAGVTVDLSNARNNRGDAAGDTFINIENIVGSNSASFLDNLRGNTSDNEISGLRGNDRITGGKGDDRLIGGEGNDTFVFAASDGNDTIQDFGDPGNRPGDFIDLSALDTSFGQLNITYGRSTVIDYGSGTITLENFNGATLGADDFIF